jgi:hypothetical protein
MPWPREKGGLVGKPAPSEKEGREQERGVIATLESPSSLSFIMPVFSSGTCLFMLYQCQTDAL